MFTVTFEPKVKSTGQTFTYDIEPRPLHTTLQKILHTPFRHTRRNGTTTMQYIVVSQGSNRNTPVFTALSDEKFAPKDRRDKCIQILSINNRRTIIRLLGQQTNKDKHTALLYIGRPMPAEASFKHHYLYIIDPRLVRTTTKTNTSTKELLSQLKLVSGSHRESTFYQIQISDDKNGFGRLNQKKVVYLINETLPNASIYHGNANFRNHARKTIRDTFATRNNTNNTNQRNTTSTANTFRKKLRLDISRQNSNILLGKDPKSVSTLYPRGKQNLYPKGVFSPKSHLDRIYITHFPKHAYPTVFHPRHVNTNSIKVYFPKLPTTEFVPYSGDKYGHIIAEKGQVRYMLLPVEEPFNRATNIDVDVPILVHDLSRNI